MLTVGTYLKSLSILALHEHTVRTTIRRWEQDGLGGLWEAPGRGCSGAFKHSGLASIGEVGE
ncbi:MAG: hypothetical protein NVSMB70_19410 [Chamaesiphon sp.]